MTDKQVFENVATLWRRLDHERALAKDFRVRPWESKAENVIRTWNELTKTENLAGLKMWFAKKDQMNPNARMASERALADCESRISGGRVDR